MAVMISVGMRWRGGLRGGGAGEEGSIEVDVVVAVDADIDVEIEADVDVEGAVAMGARVG